MIELTQDNFDKEVLKSRSATLVDFWAPWCGPCGVISPILEKLSNEYINKLKFTKINVTESEDIAAKFNVRGIPCIILFNHGKELDRIVGAYSEIDLRKKIDLILANK